MKKLLSLFTLFILSGYWLNAQPFNITITNTNPAGACKMATYNVTVTGINSNDNIHFTISNEILLDGSPLSSWPCLPLGANGNYPVVSQINTMIPASGCSILNPLSQNGVFTFTLDPMTAQGTATFSYNVYIDCAAIPNDLSTDVDFVQTWNAEVNSTPQTVLIASPGVLNTYTDESIGFPFFNHVPTVTEDTYYGAVTYLYFEYTNLGLGGDINFSFENNNSLCASAYTILETKYDINGNTYPNTVLPTNPVTVAQNDVIRIRQKIQITGCLPCSETSAVFKWNCGFSNGTNGFCPECQEVYTSTVNLVDTLNLNYSLVMSRVQPVNNGITLYGGNYGYWDITCDGNSTHWKIRVRNNGNVTLPVSRFTLSHSNSADYVFTSIDPGSITYQYYDQFNNICAPCSTSQVDTLLQTDIDNTPFLCAPYPQSLVEMKLNITNLAPGHYVEVDFDAFRCCSDDDVLFNKFIGYNQYTAGVAYSTACDADPSTLDHNGSNDLANPVTPTSQSFGITSNRYNETVGELRMPLGFTPTVTDLSVPSGQTFGATADFSVNINGLLPSLFDHQVLGVTTGLTGTTPVNAIIKAKIRCSKGLRVTSLADDVKLKSTLNPSFELLPICFYKDSNSNDCVEDNYYFFFELSTGQDVFDYMNNGRFDFTLTSCCVAIEPTTYDVSFYILRDPEDCGLSFTCQDTVTAPSCVNCCWIPLSKVGNYINVHCPGCLAPGIIVDSYRIKRTSLGFSDSDNDRIANNPMTQLDESSPEYPDLNLSYSFHGDNLEDCMVSHFQEGDYGSGGYNYIHMITPSDGDPSNELKYLQLQRLFSKKDMMNVILTGFDFYIEEPASGSSGCMDCIDCGLGDNNYNTVFEMHLNSGDAEFPLFYPDPSLSNEFFFTFSRADIEAYQAVHGGSFNNGFQENQRYRLVCRYKVCGNHSNNTLEQCDISNRMWLSSTLKPHDAFLLYAQMPNTRPVVTAPDPHFPANWADNYIFFCETFGGIHYFSGLKYYYYMPFLGLHWDGLPWYLGVTGNSTCSPKIRMVTGVYGTNDYFNLYPYEIRIPTIEPYEWTIAPPPGYTITNGRVYSDFNYYDISGNVPQYTGCYSNLTVDNFNPSLFPITQSTTLTLSDLPAMNCVSDLAQACTPVSTLSIGDLNQKLVFEFDLSVDEDTCAPGSSFNAWWSITDARFRDRSSLCGISNDVTMCTPLLDTVDCSNPDGMTLRMPDPNLALTYLPADIDVSTQQICWDFQMTNFTPGTTAYNVFLGVPANNPLYSYLTGWQLEFDGNTISIDPLTGYFNLGSVSSSVTPINGRICATYADCVAGGAMIPVYWGWNCNGIPAVMPPPATVCESDSDTISFVNIEVLLPPTSSGYPSEYSPCNLISDVYATFTSFSTNQVGETYPQEIQFSTVSGLNVSNVTLINCSTGDSLQLTYTTGWMVTPADLVALFGNPFLQVGECLTVSVDYMPNCSYTGDLPDITMVWQNYCQDLMPPSTASFTPSWVMSSDSCCFSCDSLSLVYLEKDKCEFSFNAVIPPGLDCSSASTITWDFGDGASASGAGVSHQYINDGTYVVCYTFVCYEAEIPSDSCMVCDTLVVDCVKSEPDTFCLKIPKTNDPDIGYGIAETADGGFVLAGTIYQDGAGGDKDMFISKYSAAVTQEYLYRIGDHTPYTFNEDGRSILVRPDGYYVAGTIYENSADEDVFVAKYAPDGTFLFSKRYGSGNNRKEGANKIIDMSTSTDDALLVVGYAEVAPGDLNMLAIKLRPWDLSVMDVNTYFYPAPAQSNEIGNDAVKTGVHTMTDHFAIVGEQHITPSDKNVMVVIINTNLAKLNGKVYSAEERSETGNSIVANSDMNGASLYITGASSRVGGNEHLLVLKVSAFSLVEEANAIYLHSNSTIEVGNEIMLDQDRNLVVVGVNDTKVITSGPDALILKLKANNTLMPYWSMSTTLQPFSERFHGVTTYGSDYYLATGSYPGSWNGDEDIFVAKINKSDGSSCCLNPYPMAAKSVKYKLFNIDEKEVKLKDSIYGESEKWASEEFICPGIHNNVRISHSAATTQSSTISLYPNPSNGRFRFLIQDGTERSLVNVFIKDLSGRVIKDARVQLTNMGEGEFDGELLTTGVYFVEVNDGPKWWVGKIIINK